MTANADLMARLVKRFQLEGVPPKDVERLAGLAAWEVDMTPDLRGGPCLCPCHLPPNAEALRHGNDHGGMIVGAMTPTADSEARYPLVEFLSPETMVNALEGYGVACEGDDAGTWIGELRPWKISPDEDIFMVGLWAAPDGSEFIGATDIRNFTKITVL